MKITNEHSFEQINTLPQVNKEDSLDKSRQTIEKMSGYLMEITGHQNTWTGTYQKDALTLDELSAQMGLPTQDLQKMYMAVMSNTVSDEEYAEMMEDGYQVTDMDVETMVTILDQIKVELAKAGTEIQGYTDSVDRETLEQIVGNQAYAQALEKGLEDPAFAYVLKNQLEPTLENIYKATYSAGKENYDASSVTWDVQNAGMMKQMDQVIEAAGLEVNEQYREAAMFMVEHEIPLTPESLWRYDEWKEFRQPQSIEDYKQHIINGMERGKEPGQVDLSQAETLYEQAIRIKEEVDRVTEEDLTAVAQEAKPLHLKNLKRYHNKAVHVMNTVDSGKLLAARKTLEEVRLQMSVEANLRLLRKGIQIDTMPMQQLIKELEMAQQELSDMDVLSSKAAVQEIQSLQEMPAYTLGFAFTQEIAFTVHALHEKGVELQSDLAETQEPYQPLLADYAKVTEKYEQLQTAPRADLGDSIRKAFRNVDDILTDLGKDASEENRRAVRILGYHQIEITEENLQKARDMDEKVQHLFHDLKPGRVLQMIRDGVDVLHTNIETLDEYLTAMENQFVESSESYAKFLQKLERTGDITEKERESFIGIYRLVRQVEKSDGAAMGHVMASSAEFTLDNLLASIRSDKRKHLDYLLDDHFTGVDKRDIGQSITKQIQAAFRQEPSKSFLEQFHQPVTIANLISANNMLSDGSGVYKELAKRDSEKEFEQICERLSDTMTDEESLQKGFEEFEKQTSVMLEKVLYDEENTFLDIRAMQGMYKQIRLTTALAKESYYQIPVKTEEDYTLMHVHVKHTGDTPSMEIQLEWAEYGMLKAQYQFSENGDVERTLQTESVEAQAFLEEVSALTEADFAQKNRSEKVSARELCQMAKIFLQTIRKK